VIDFVVPKRNHLAIPIITVMTFSETLKINTTT